MVCYHGGMTAFGERFSSGEPLGQNDLYRGLKLPRLILETI
jgi:hypothetical protein